MVDRDQPPHDVDMIPTNEPAISDGGIDEVQTTARLGLPLDLPPDLKGLESLVAETTWRFVRNPNDALEVERVARGVVSALQRRILGYQALGRMATNKQSLPAQLVNP
jgi:hypothetical protein